VAIPLAYEPSLISAATKFRCYSLLLCTYFRGLDEGEVAAPAQGSVEPGDSVGLTLKAFLVIASIRCLCACILGFTGVRSADHQWLLFHRSEREQARSQQEAKGVEMQSGHMPDDDIRERISSW
jgi:hypothetical protein